MKSVMVADLSLGLAALREELLGDILRIKEPRLLEERRRLHRDHLQLEEGVQQAQDALVDYIISEPCPLHHRMDFLPRVSGYEERQRQLCQSLGDAEALQQRVEEKVSQYLSAAQRGCTLYSHLQEVCRLCPQYRFPARSILCWARQALCQHEDSSMALEEVLVSGILRHALPALTEEHAHVLRLLMASSQPRGVEWFSFLGLVHHRSQPSSSCIQKPPWLEAGAWEELGHLEKMTCFRGIRSSVSAQPQPWREYFSLRSTLIGPVPCSAFSHLTLFQTAILWRILKPESLGRVLTHLTLCVLGPEPADWMMEEHIVTLSDPHSPVIFPLPAPAALPCHPRHLILHQARRAGKEVEELTWRETLPQAEIRKVLLRSQQEGRWVLLHWHPNLTHVLEVATDPAELHPDFRMCVVVEEAELSAVLALMGHSLNAAPCVLHPRLRLLLPQSCMVIAENSRRRDSALLRLLLFHIVLLFRQEYSDYVQSHVYAWGHEELSLAVRCTERMSADCSDAMVYLAGDVIYGGHVVEGGDVASVMAMAQHCLQDQPLSRLSSTLRGSQVSGAGDPGIRRFLQTVLPRLEPAALGLSEGLQAAAMESLGGRVLSSLLVTQDVWTATDSLRPITGQRTGNEEPSPRSALANEEPLSCCLSLLMAVYDMQAAQQRKLDALHAGHSLQEGRSCHQADGNLKEEAPEGAPCGSQSPSRRLEPIRSFLWEEWDVLRGLIRQALQELKEAESLCRCPRCRQVRERLSEGRLPPWWEVYSAPPSPPLTPQAWTAGLQTRLKLLSTYLSAPPPPSVTYNLSAPPPPSVTYNLSAFRHPTRLLHRVLMERALHDPRGLEPYSLHVQVCGAGAPPAGAVRMALGGLQLKHALWDTRLRTLQETLCPRLCPLPELLITAVQRNSRAPPPPSTTPTYLCPVYAQEAPDGHAQHQQQPLLLIPLPTTLPPSVWHLRRVHALSLL